MAGWGDMVGAQRSKRVKGKKVAAMGRWAAAEVRKKINSRHTLIKKV